MITAADCSADYDAAVQDAGVQLLSAGPTKINSILTGLTRVAKICNVIAVSAFPFVKYEPTKELSPPVTPPPRTLLEKSFKKDRKKIGKR